MGGSEEQPIDGAAPTHAQDDEIGVLLARDSENLAVRLAGAEHGVDRAEVTRRLRDGRLEALAAVVLALLAELLDGQPPIGDHGLV